MKIKSAPHAFDAARQKEAQTVRVVVTRIYTGISNGDTVELYLREGLRRFTVIDTPLSITDVKQGNAKITLREQS